MPTKPRTFNPFPKPAAPPRLSAHRRGYGRRWEKLARCYLAANPLCIDPFGDHAGRVVPAECVDHVVPRSRGGTDDVTYSRACAPGAAQKREICQLRPVQFRATV
jgi:hypothetical protein